MSGKHKKEMTHERFKFVEDPDDGFHRFQDTESTEYKCQLFKEALDNFLKAVLNGLKIWKN